jgi:hypothetical protein
MLGCSTGSRVRSGRAGRCEGGSRSEGCRLLARGMAYVAHRVCAVDAIRTGLERAGYAAYTRLAAKA